MIALTQQIVCSIVSRQLIADLSPTSRQPIATYFQSVQVKVKRSLLKHINIWVHKVSHFNEQSTYEQNTHIR